MIAPNKPKPFDSKNNQDKENPSISAGFIIFKNSWLAILDEIREKDRENVLSQTEALKQLDMKEMEELSKQNYFVYN